MRLRNPDEAKWLEQSGWLKLTPVQYRQVRKTPGQVFQVSWSSATKFCKLLGGPGCNRLIKKQYNVLELPLLNTENYTGKNRRRAQKVAGYHRNTLSAVMGQFQHARRVRFLGRETSGYNRCSSPQKADRNHPRKLGAAKSMINTPFQQDIENPTADSVPFEPLGPLLCQVRRLNGLLDIDIIQPNPRLPFSIHRLNV